MTTNYYFDNERRVWVHTCPRCGMVINRIIEYVEHLLAHIR